MEFDPGYERRPYHALVADYPGPDVYPEDSFRVEWGPIFHRGRLDGTARVLIIGQDPAAHEAICRRILVGEAGQRTQALLTRLGLTHSYLLINALLYSVYGQGGGTRHVNDAGVAEYRHSWLDAIVADNPLDAIISLGTLADSAYQTWKATPNGAANTAAYAAVRHPTYPESASRSGVISKAEAMQRLTTSWNGALDALHPVVTQDQPTPLQHFGAAITKNETVAIPDRDLPPGLPSWMRSLDAWAARTGTDAQIKRATITVTVPRAARTWPPID